MPPSSLFHADSWGNLITKLSQVKCLDMDAVVTLLLTKELRRNTNLNSSAVAMVVRGRPSHNNHG